MTAAPTTRAGRRGQGANRSAVTLIELLVVIGVIALLLAILLGPHAAFLVVVSILTVQALLFGDGGTKRIVWMPKELKSRIAEEFKKRAEEVGVPDLLDKIADETVCEDAEKLVEHLTAVGHPALEMDPIIQ